jgi:hypothetical protein
MNNFDHIVTRPHHQHDHARDSKCHKGSGVHQRAAGGTKLKTTFLHKTSTNKDAKLTEIIILPKNILPKKSMRMQEG